MAATNDTAEPASTADKATMRTGESVANDAPSGWMDMKKISSRIRVRSGSKDQRGGVRDTDSSSSADPSALNEVTSNDGLLGEDDEAREGSGGTEGPHLANGAPADGATTYKVYKRRWFGLFQLALLNIIVSWDVSTFFLMSPLGSDI